jgi:hypothetical protein
LSWRRFGSFSSSWCRHRVPEQPVWHPKKLLASRGSGSPGSQKSRTEFTRNEDLRMVVIQIARSLRPGFETI